MTVTVTRVVPGRLTDLFVTGPDPVPAVTVFVLVVAAVTTDENTA